jgi:hypothetical protein
MSGELGRGYILEGHADHILIFIQKKNGEQSGSSMLNLSRKPSEDFK